MDNRRIGIQIGYTLGFSALAAALIYFYASNWPMLSRGARFVPVFLFVVGLYGLSVYLSGRMGRELLSRLALLGSLIAFGVGLAVIGQTYNSHADSYGLFLVWALPSLIFAYLTRWQPLDVLTYLLGNTAYYMYFHPNTGWVGYSETREFIILLVWACIQGLLFIWTTRNKGLSPVIRLISFIMLVYLMLHLSNGHEFGSYGYVMNLPLAAGLFLGIRYFHSRGDKLYFLWTGLAVSATVITKYVELTGYFFSELFILTSFLFVIGFIGANVWFLKIVQRTFPSSENTESQLDGAPTTAEPSKSGFGVWVVKVLTVSAILIGTIIGLISFIGLNYVIFEWEKPEYVLMGFGFVFVVGMLLARRVHTVVRYVLIGVGLVIGTVPALFTRQDWVLGVFTALTVYAFLVEAGWARKIFFFVCSVGLGTIFVNQLLEHVEGSFWLMGGLLGLLSLASSRSFGWNPLIRAIVQIGGFTGFLAALFILTFMGESSVYYVYNGLFVAVCLGAIVYGIRRQAPWLLYSSFGFWMAYLVYKYYDLAWKLLHKSFSLAVFGLLIMGLVYTVEKRWGVLPSKELGTLYPARPRLLLTVLLVILQLMVMSLQIGKSEWVLAHGATIKLELAPRDPRSLLQGDYVVLRYDISEPEGVSWERLDSWTNHKVKVILRPDPNGIYRYAGLMEDHTVVGETEVVLNGRYDGFRGFIYGIENYFVPEGTGLQVEQDARFAEVKVASNGDALLVRLLKKEE